jgi:orotidine-5'-phosphate decarboxylase
LEPKERIIFALDVADNIEAMGLAEKLANLVGCFKIGLQRIFNMFRNGEWPAFRKFLNELNAEIFIDSKLNDIPNTIAGSAKEIAKLEPLFFNVHASSGIEAMKEAGKNSGNSRVLAVTVLTSLGEDEAHHIFGNPSKTKVLELAMDARLAGIGGIICSAQELKLLRKQKELDGMLMVTPGIRPEWAAAGDQKRITTPREAILDGADYLVIGRPIQNPPAEVGSPEKAAIHIASEIAAALEEKARKEK